MSLLCEKRREDVDAVWKGSSSVEGRSPSRQLQEPEVWAAVGRDGVGLMSRRLGRQRLRHSKKEKCDRWNFCSQKTVPVRKKERVCLNELRAAEALEQQVLDVVACGDPCRCATMS